MFSICLKKIKLYHTYRMEENIACLSTEILHNRKFQGLSLFLHGGIIRSTFLQYGVKLMFTHNCEISR